MTDILKTQTQQMFKNREEQSNEGGEKKLIFSPPQSYLDEIEDVPLASQGRFYPAPFNKPTLKCRKLNYTDEDLLTTEQKYLNGTLIYDLLKAVIVEPNFNVDDLLACDKDGILIWLRLTTFGTTYQTRHQCPKCEKRGLRTWNLGEVEYPDFDAEYEQEIIEKGGVEIYLTPLSEDKPVVKALIGIPAIKTMDSIKKFLDDLVIGGKLSGDKTYLITGYLLSVIKKLTITLPQEEPGTITKFEEVYEYLTQFPIPIPISREIQRIAKQIELNVKYSQTFACKDMKGSYSHFDTETEAKLQKEREAGCTHVEEDVRMNLDLTAFFWPERYKG